MKAYEWLHQAFVDAGMEREAEGMQWALKAFEMATETANWQTNRRMEVEAQRDELLAALNAMLTHMGMDEDEWNKPTFDQARAAIAKVKP